MIDLIRLAEVSSPSFTTNSLSYGIQDSIENPLKCGFFIAFLSNPVQYSPMESSY